MNQLLSIMPLILSGLFCINLLGSEVTLVGKVPVGESDVKNISWQIEVSQISNNGKFQISNFINNSSDCIVMDSDGKYIIFKKTQSYLKTSTNILQTIVENGVLKVIQIEKQESVRETNDGLAIFNTFSTNGYISTVNQTIQFTEQKFKISANSKELIDSISNSSNKVKITKYDAFGNLLKSSSYDGVFPHVFPQISDESDGGPSTKYQVFVNIENGYMYIYRINFEEAMVSNNSIKLKVLSSKNNSINLGLITESTNQLNIQSSTNLIDWNTFKTIQNEPSLEIVVPANKPKEFIRTIE